MPQNHQCPVGNDFIGVHIGRSPGTALDQVYHKLIVQQTVFYFFTGLNNGIFYFTRQESEFVVRKCGSLFYFGKSFDKKRIQLEIDAAHVKVFEGALCLYPVINMFGYFEIAEQVMLQAYSFFSSCHLVRYNVQYSEISWRYNFILANLKIVTDHQLERTRRNNR
jgi:hypothetical protein